MKQFDYILGFVFQNKYLFKNVIKKVAIEPKRPRGRWVWIIDTCLLQGGKHDGAIGES